MNRRAVLGLLTLPLLGFVPGLARAQNPIRATLYKNPQCGCCDVYIDYLRPQGFEVAVQNTVDLGAIKRQARVPRSLEGCHTMLVENYVVEGLVPIATLRRLLAERPPIIGISLPGMPVGAPGMPGTAAGPLLIFEISELAALQATPKVYAIE